MSGIISSNTKRRRSAVSSSAMDRSAVFIVPTTCRFAGTPNSVFEPGSVTRVSSSRPIRFESSIRVINSPKIAAMLPRLISSMTST